jgi:hypothetical protein
MDEKDLKDLLQSRRRKSFRRSWRCPDEIQIAAYADHQLEATARELVSTHLANCDFCLSQISFLLQARDWANPDQVPPDVLRRARDLVSRKSGRATTWGWRWVAASATAACLVLLLAFITLRFLGQPTVNAPSEPLVAQQHQPNIVPLAPNSPATPRAAAQPSATKTRSVEPAGPAIRGGDRDLLPTVVFPADGATLPRSELDFRWEPVADTVFYDVRVVTAAGELIHEAKTEDTHLRLADDIQLAPGGKYFVSIRAHVREGKTVKSNIVSFRISER